MGKADKKQVLILIRPGEDLSSLEKALEQDFDFRSVHGKGEAVRYIRQYPPDIFVVDLQIPRIDPFKMLDELRGTHPGIGLLALFKTGQDKLAERAVRSGVDACAPLPGDGTDFIKIVTDVIDKAVARRGAASGKSKSADIKYLLEHVVDISPDAILATDNDGNINFYSKGSAKIFGYNEREILGRSVARLFAKGNEEMHTVLDVLRGKGKVSDYEVDFLKKDGKRIIGILNGSLLSDSSGDDVNCLFIIKDITGAIKLEHEIYESKIELESVFDSIIDPLAVIGKDYKVSRANRAAAAMVGMGIKEVVGQICHELLHHDKKMCVSCPVGETYRTGEASFAEIESVELGEIFHVYSYPIFDYRGNLKGVIEHRSIVTDQKKLEEERHRLEIELMERHKLSSVGLLAQGIAHNLNTPLGVIMGRSGLLKDDIRQSLQKAAGFLKEQGAPDAAISEIEEAEQQSDRILEIILKQVDNMSSIIRNLMDIGRQRQDAERKKLNVNHILEQELRFLDADMFFKHDITRTIELDPGMPYIEGVYSHFSQSFTNIIRNAMDAMFDQPVKELRVRTHHDDNWIYVEIHDTGEGIDKTHLPKIFDPFFTTKDFGGAEGKPPGVGLGLHSCYQLLSPYKVKFNVESVPGDTTFTIRIPR